MPTLTAYTAKIASSLVNVLGGSLDVTNEIGQRSQGHMQVWGPLGVVWQYGTQVLVYDDTGAQTWAGYVSKDKATKSGAPLGSGYLEHDLQLMDNCYRADKRRAHGSFLNASAGSIVRALVDTILAAENVTYTAASIATGTTIVEAVWTYNKSVSEALTWLATQSGYWWTIDQHGVLWFQPYTGVAAPFILDGTQVEAGVVGKIEVEYGNDMYVNSQFVKGSYMETPQLTETLIGNSQSRSFTLSYPVSSIKTATLNGVDITNSLGTKDQIGSSSFAYYYAAGDQVIAQDPAQPLLASSDHLVITYKGRQPTIARAQNPALITAQQAREGGGSGLVEAAYSNTRVKTQAAAFQIAGNLLSHYGQDTTLLTFTTRAKGLAEGQMLTVHLSDFALNGKQMLISSVEETETVDGFNIWFVVQAVGSPVESVQWQTFWANLMGQYSDPSDLTDVDDGAALALVSASTLTRTPTISVSQRVTTGPICGVSMLCGNWTVA